MNKKNFKINILSEFEKRYRAIPSDTESICEAISQEFGLDAEKVKEVVYLTRYETVDEILDQEPEVVED